MKDENYVEILNFKVIKNDLEFVKGMKHILINTISPNSYGLTCKDQQAKEALQNSDFLILDGVYFGWAALLLKGKKIKRITGWDIFMFFSHFMNEQKGRVFFLGSSNETLEKIKKRYKFEFPEITSGFYSPPFKAEFSESDLIEMRKAINDFKPDVLFVGMTAPKQEKWSYQNKPFLDVSYISTIGNVFDWYAGNSIRPNTVWQKLGLEWLIRIYYRPEIFRRNISNQMLFFWHLLLMLLKLKKYD